MFEQKNNFQMKKKKDETKKNENYFSDEALNINYTALKRVFKHQIS